MPIPELVGSAEAAKLLEIGPTNFSHLRRKMEIADDKNFPAPVAKLQCGPIWAKSAMVKFKKHYDSRRRRVHSANGDNAAAVETPAPKAKAPAKPRAPRKATAKTTKATPAKTTSKRTPRKKLVVAS